MNSAQRAIGLTWVSTFIFISVVLTYEESFYENMVVALCGATVVLGILVSLYQIQVVVG